MASTLAEAIWLPSGQDCQAATLRLIGLARRTVQLQTYIFRDDDCGRRVREALTDAAGRGVRVRVLIDALGSHALPEGFFDALRIAGGEVRRFNPLHPKRIAYRNHRKLLVCDHHAAIVGGFNIGDEYAGDGLTVGWCDLGLKVRGVLAEALAGSFDRMYVLAVDRPRRMARLRVANERRRVETTSGQLLLGGPGRGDNPLKASLMRDLGKASTVLIISPYFLPTWGLRRRLMKLARKGGRVRLLLPAHSDIRLALHASRSLYARLLRAGVEILEYQPQVLHAKLVITDRAVYAGSANFNTRSLHIDYELMLRLDETGIRERAEGLFDALSEHGRPIDRHLWAEQQGWWDRLRQKLAYWAMARLDPLIARWLWRP